MDRAYQHVESCARSVGVPFNRAAYLRWCRNPADPDRRKIEQAFGRVFAHVAMRPEDWRSVQQPILSHVIAVTSLPPSPKPRHIRAVQSWKQAGLNVVSINSTSEVRQLRGRVAVDEFIASDELPTAFKVPTQYVHTMLRMASKLGESVLMINSDIEMLGSQNVIRQLGDNEAMIGIRTNYSRSFENVQRERWGLDVFHLPRSIAESIPESIYAIGRPFWDYWLPWLLQRDGVNLRWVGEAVFFHERHPQAWSDDDWQLGRAWFEETYDVSINWETWRRRQPFPPTRVTKGL